MKPRILIVDDEDTIRYFLKLELEQAGYEAWDAASGGRALRLLQTRAFDAVILDLRLPDISGQEVMHHCREHAPETSIIIITAYATLDSAIDALRHGAHDYILKPFDTAEVLASVADGIARRGAGILPVGLGEEVREVGPLRLDPQNRQAFLNDVPLRLTPTEFDLLACLMRAPNTALDSVTLLKRIRGYQISEAEARSIVRVHIHRLRHKVEADPSNPTLITTVQGGRYLLAAE